MQLRLTNDIVPFVVDQLLLHILADPLEALVWARDECERQAIDGPE